MMAENDVDFLRNQVQHLNAQLAQYQQKYPLLGLNQPSPREKLDAPWLIDNNLMSPLLAEYQSQMNLMREQIDIYETKQRELRSQVDKLINENKRLTRELKDSLQSNLDLASDDDLDVEAAAVADDSIVQNLQTQLHMALQEKENAMEMWHSAVQELERTQRESQLNNVESKVRSYQLQAAQIKDQYARSVDDLNAEVASLQEELHKSRREHKMALSQVAEMRKTLETMRLEVKRQERERGDVTAAKEVAHGQMSDLQRSTAQLQSKVEESVKMSESLRKENMALEDRILELQKKIADQELKDYEMMLQMRDSVQMVENAMLEKDQALMREQQSVEEVTRLRNAISSLLDEAGARTRQEVDEVKKQCNQNISRLMEEIHALEMESSERQAQCDRAIREKRAAEGELEQLYKEGLQSGAKDSSAFEDLNRRACNAERTRDEALVKLDAMSAEHRRLEMTLKQEKNHLAAEVEQLKERLALVNQEFEDANGDRVKLCGQVDELKKKASRAQQERDLAQRNLSKELACMEQEVLRKEREAEVKLQALEDTHRKTATELRQMLAQQQRMSAKWKEECRSTASRMETKINDLRSEIGREKKRNTELTKLLKDSKDKTSEAEQMLSEYSRNLKTLESRIRDAEQRAFTRPPPVSKTINLDRDIVAERKQLQRQLERSLRESQASLQSGTLPEPLAISDLMGSSLKKSFTEPERLSS